MTTIAYRDGVMAADTRAYAGYNHVWGQKTKIVNVNGRLLGVSSNAPGMADKIRGWFCRGGDWSATPDTGECNFDGIIVDPDGRALLFTQNWYPSLVTADYYSIGSGSKYATGAMAMGAGAELALRIACRFDVWSEEPITVLRHHDTAERQDASARMPELCLHGLPADDCPVCRH